MTTEEPASWSVEDSRRLYLIERWGTPYFGVNETGHVEVKPSPDRSTRIDLYELVEQLEARGIEMPVLIRFPDILEHRIAYLNECFATAIEAFEYQGVYRGVFPIKVNQQRHIVRAVVAAGRRFRYGLEAGSKPELLIALAEMDEDEGFIVCNGYKDRAFIETALFAQQCGKTVVIVLERADEIDVVLAASQKLGIRPILGVRGKLTTRGIGRWAASAGDRAKFGLTTTQIIEVVDKLRAHDMLDCLQLLHFHLGSQISAITPWKKALREAGRIYVELHKLGCPMGYLDVGGGLAVDYDGSKTDFHASMNYGVQEYANDVVAGIMSACDEAEIAHPTIVSESGRAVAAHQSVLVFEAVSEARVSEHDARRPPEDAAQPLLDLWEVYDGIATSNLQESWHDTVQIREEARSRFRFGYLSLTDLAQLEELFSACCARISERAKHAEHVPEELEELEELLGDMYYCNFSIFQSAPDMWALDQLFPIMPVHRLDERPTVRATLADLTCDSDGVIKSFIDLDEPRDSLDVHEVKDGERYLLAMFLGGAYQEILGDLHNLFGDTNAVQILVSERDGYTVRDFIKGDTVAEVLAYVQYDAEKMVERVRRQAERSLEAGRMTLEQVGLFMRHYEEAIHGSTYLKSETSHD